VSGIEKVKNKINEAVGKVKEAAGKVTDDPRLEYEGKADQTAANLRQAGEHAKDSAEKVKDAFPNRHWCR
jgi:uncharacterized protein YjbJ (UPF0337 family)